jgi:hypothetical protein
MAGNSFLRTVWWSRLEDTPSRFLAWKCTMKIRFHFRGKLVSLDQNEEADVIGVNGLRVRSWSK